MVTREEFYVDSVDGIHMIHGFRWYNTDKAYRGVIQIVHGMLEYIERYDEFSRAMAESGYFVIGHDHLGHGDSVKDSEELGYVGEQGAVLWLRDMEQIRRMAVSYAPKVPYIMLGHSMGSYLVRRYLIYHGNRVDGAVIMGTGQQNPLLVKTGLLVTYLDMMRIGPKGHSKFLDQMTCSGFVRKFPDNRKTGSWVSRDPQVLIHTLQDPLMNFGFTLNAYEALLRTIEEATDPRRVVKMPRDLPILILSGDEDPVGGNGKGVRRFEKMLKRAGMKNVTCMLYPHARHELLNDLDKEQVLHDIEHWCDTIERRNRR